ncbi:single-stranded DNA-binding protein [Citricoccus nitrophenolicus]|uniref:Single-stranded DNA-binding protein n=1 Tax=Citricoccus nitrophenolicus TaxID=863575 RepID=A0ABV0IE28_9MICC
MSEHITVRGFVATDPTTRTTPSGLAVGNFRLASTDRRFDREQQAWVDGATNWFTVNMFRQLSTNVAASLSKGQPVLVTGRLKVRQWQNEERSGTSVEIEAETIGHDLTLGTAFFNRAVGRTAPAEGTPGGEAVSEEPEGTVDRETGELLGGSGPDAVEGFADAGHHADEGADHGADREEEAETLSAA